MSATRDGNKIDLSSSWSYMTSNNNFIHEVRGGSDSGSYSRRQDYRGEYDRNYDDKFDGRGNFEDSTDYYDDKYGDTDHSDRSYVGKDKAFSASIPNFPNIIKNGDKRIGLALLGSGTIFTMLGISLFFNKSLMRLGNLLFIAGVPMTIGPGRTAGYFFQPKKSRATACLALGIFLVFLGSPVLGIALEVFGLLNLFGNMFPLVAVLIKQVPFVGTLFGSGGLGKNADTRRSSRERDQYEDIYNDPYGNDAYENDQYENDRLDRRDEDSRSNQRYYSSRSNDYY